MQYTTSRIDTDTWVPLLPRQVAKVALCWLHKRLSCGEDADCTLFKSQVAPAHQTPQKHQTCLRHRGWVTNEEKKATRTGKNVPRHKMPKDHKTSLPVPSYTKALDFKHQIYFSSWTTLQRQKMQKLHTVPLDCRHTLLVCILTPTTNGLFT